MYHFSPAPRLYFFAQCIPINFCLEMLSMHLKCVCYTWLMLRSKVNIHWELCLNCFAGVIRKCDKFAMDLDGPRSVFFYHNMISLQVYPSKVQDYQRVLFYFWFICAPFTFWSNINAPLWTGMVKIGNSHYKNLITKSLCVAVAWYCCGNDEDIQGRTGEKLWHVLVVIRSAPQ